MDGFPRAVAALDANDLDELRRLLSAHPELGWERAPGGEGYFADPYLLWFVAENPIRQGRMPEGILDATRMLIDAAAGDPSYQEQVDYALGLVGSGCVARESGVQPALIDLFVAAGADPDGAVLAAAAHRELDAVRRLRDRGARESALVAAAIGTAADVDRVAAGSSDIERQAALMIAALLGRADVIRVLVAHGADVAAYGPPGAHAHSTPLHQAALAGHADAAAALVEAGAPTSARDRTHDATPAGWAAHSGHHDLAATLT